MNTWWTAIDRTWSSYAELSRRGAVAQGWPALGDLRTLIRFHPSARDAFIQAVIALGDHTYRGETLWDEKDRRPQRAPAQSVHGVKRLVGESDAVAEAWDRAGFACKPIPACWVNVDLPTGLCTIHRETCRHALNARRTPYKGHGDLLRDGGWLEFNSRDAAESYTDWLIDVRSRLNVLHCSECR